MRITLGVRIENSRDVNGVNSDLSMCMNYLISFQNYSDMNNLSFSIVEES